MARTRKEKNLAMVLKLCDEQQEQLGRFLIKLLNIKGKEEEAFLVVDISDTGIGISQEKLPFIFDEFFRVKTKDTESIAGSGLGLPIAKKIIEAHYGSIRVVSELAKGTTFSILLPKAEVRQ